MIDDTYTIVLIWLGAVWLLWLPGVLLSKALKLRHNDVLVQMALQVGLGLVFWPLLLLWSSTLGWRWSPVMAQIVVLLVGIGGLIILAKDGFHWWSKQKKSKVPKWATWFLLGLIFNLTIATRILHIRNLILPAWVDSVYHTMIVRVILNAGSLPETYEPFIPTGQFFHHWGYHALVAWLTWLLGWSKPLHIAQLMLHIGQLFNVLTVLTLYAAGRVLFNSRRVGLVAALLGSLISWFPAYYVTWGHYSQLVGLLVLPIFGIMLWRFHKRPTLGQWLAVVLLGAGLLTIHVRVTVFAITWTLALGGAILGYRLWWERKYSTPSQPPPTKGRSKYSPPSGGTRGGESFPQNSLPITSFNQGALSFILLWSTIGLGVIFIDLPWLLILLQNSYLLQVFSATSGLQSGAWIDLSDIPWHLVWMTHNRELYALVTGGLSGVIGWNDMPWWGRVISAMWGLLLIGAVIRLWHNHSKTRPTLSHLAPLGVLLVWVGVTTVALNLNLIGLPPIRFIDNFTGIISLYIPLSLIGGAMIIWVVKQLTSRQWQNTVISVIIIGGALWGSLTMIDVVKLPTVLIQPADIRAMEWIETNTAPDATFAINVWSWLPSIYAGTDGGYWIQLLTDRPTVVPPAIIYPIAAEYDIFQQTNAFLAELSEARSLDNPALLAQLRERGVTHIYLGARGGHLNPNALESHDFTRLVYQDGPVYIFELIDE